jgi:diguanylate cyclase (GGDEF)-like protein
MWEETLARLRRALSLGSVRNRMLASVVVATLLPALATVLTYRQTQPSLNDAITQELRSVSAETAREMDQWLDDRLSELRVAAGSYAVSENLKRIRPGAEGGQALERLRAYLTSVRERLTDYEVLGVTDARGRVVTSSGSRGSGVQLPPDRLSGLRTGDALVGDAYWDAPLGSAAIMLAVPIRDADGRFLGACTAKINLHSVATLVDRLSPGDSGDVYLMTEQGKLVIRSRVSSAALMRTKLAKSATDALFDKEGTTVPYKRWDGQDVVGTLRRVPQLRLAAVAEVPRAETVRPGSQPRNGPGLILAALLAGAGVMGVALGLLIVRPLGRLSGAAAKVAAGDLAVQLPPGGTGELGSLTQVFNTMVARLRERESTGELERLSVTDALTGLYNRRHLMGTLANEVQRSRRLRRTFAVLLADVDHFKQYNDTRGHLAGDAALVKIAEILRKMTRAVDSVARYGGEEFVVLLLETTIATALIVAERIRARVAGEAFEGGTLTVSVGAAEYPAHGDTPEELIASADAAMYQAKKEGRDRVAGAGGQRRGEKEGKKRRRAED